ncbi:MAG: alpha/beta hydrolase, partial [Alphaproteobacteria bacterium]|nr:alpha/beta hydrolase [Alphaproteobacteria bacterium]
MSALRWFLALAIGYGLLVGAIALLQRRLIYFPDRKPSTPEAAGLSDMRRLDLVAEDGVQLVAWYKPAATGRHPTVLYLHGNAGSIAHRGPKVRPLLGAGLGALLLSWRGYGGGAGSPSEVGLGADARAGLAALRRMGVPSDRIVIYGESLGTALAVKLGATQPVAGLIL